MNLRIHQNKIKIRQHETLMEPVWILICYYEKSINKNKSGHTESHKMNEHRNIKNIKLPKVMTTQFERGMSIPRPHSIT